MGGGRSRQQAAAGACKALPVQRCRGYCIQGERPTAPLPLPSSPAGAKAAVEYALRVAFGTALFVSVAAVFTAIAVVASSGQQSDRDRRRDGGGFGYYGGGPRFYFDLTDLLWYW